MMSTKPSHWWYPQQQVLWGDFPVSPVCFCLLPEHDPPVFPFISYIVFQQLWSLNPSNRFSFCSSCNWFLVLATKCSHRHVNVCVPPCSQFPCALFSLGLSQLAINHIESYLTNDYTLNENDLLKIVIFPKAFAF